MDNEVLRIINKGILEPDDGLFLFSLYVSSNPDFKYNTSYLTDSINSFKRDFQIYKNKLLLFNKIIEYSRSIVPPEYDVTLIFENKFKFNLISDSKLELYSLQEENLLFKLEQEKVLLKLVLSKPLIEYSHLFNLEDSDKIWEVKIDQFINIIKVETSGK
ncbi:MAG: hypothetical protein ACM3MI_07305 [Clostridiales bacterium]